MQPLFSIIIPAYRELALFKRALQSVLAQEHTSYEIIVVDDTDDNNIENYILGHPHPNLRYKHNTPARGAVPNWNFGLSLAQGRYIILLHHDEAFASPQYLNHLEPLMAETPIAITTIEVHYHDQTYKLPFPTWAKKIILSFPLLLFMVNPIGPTACLCFRKEIIQPFDENLHWLVDVEWYYRLLRKATFTLSPIIVTSTHGHKEQITNNINTRQQEQTDRRYLYTKYKTNLLLKTILYIRPLIRKIHHTYTAL